MKTVKDLITNKKVVFYGDSITHNWEKFDHDLNLTHTDPNHEYGLGYGHVKMMNDVCHFKTVDNFAVSGGCYANTYYLNPQRPVWRHFPHQIVVSKDKLIAADVIFIMMGSNDFSEQTPFGYYKEVATDHNQDNMTFHQGINFGYQKIKELNPNALVFVINILQRTVGVDPHATFNYSVNEYNLAIAHMCKEYGFNLIDVSNVFKAPDNFVGGNKELYSDDGLHPNEKGYIALTNAILNHVVEK